MNNNIEQINNDVCIYLGKKDNLHFDSREHIFPEALGGRQKLPNNFVSREANNLFSKLEREFFKKNTIVSHMRTMIMEKKESPVVNTSNDINISGYYTNDGEFCQVPTIVLSNLNDLPKISAFIPQTMDYDVELNNIVNKIKEDLKKDILSINIQENFPTGYAKLNCKKIKNEKYEIKLLVSSEKDVEIIKNIFDDNFNNKFSVVDSKEETIENIEINIKITDDISLFYKIFSKISINLLAFTFGKDFVCKNEFQQLKNIILEKEKNNLAEYFEYNVPNLQLKSLLQELFSDNKTSSSIYISNISNNLIATVDLFNCYNFSITLIKNTDILKYNQPVFYFINHRKREEIFSKNFPEFLTNNISRFKK